MAHSPTSQGRSPRAWSKAGPGFGLVVLALLSLLACSAAAAWMHFSVAERVLAAGDALRAETAREQSVADALVTAELVQDVAGGDYGEVQEALERFERSGYLTRAVFVSVSGKSIAAIGGSDGLKIGDTVPAQMLAAGRLIELKLGSQKLGQLLVLERPSASVDTHSKEVAGMRIAAILVAILALISAGAVVWLRQETRREVEAARRSASRPLAAPKLADLPLFFRTGSAGYRAVDDAGH